MSDTAIPTISPMIADRLPMSAAAPYVGMATITLHRKTMAGVIPSLKIGGRRYWLRSDLDAYLASCRQGGADQ